MHPIEVRLLIQAMERSAILTVRKWGKSLAIRIPSAVARSAGFKAGQLVQVSVNNPMEPVLHLGIAQRLPSFDPTRHGGEAMAASPIGNEAL